MVDFGGWELPQQYTSIRDEHLAVRQVAGLFDISHMGRLYVEGPAAEAYLQRLMTNDIARLGPGHAMYTLMCKEDGGVIDDLVVYRELPDRFLVVVNAANREKDVAWMNEHLDPGVTLVDRTAEVSLIAFQGPKAAQLLPDGSTDPEDIPYFGFRPGELAALFKVPEPDRAPDPGSQGPASVGGKGDAPELVFGVMDRPKFSTVGDVPEAKRMVSPGREHAGPVLRTR